MSARGDGDEHPRDRSALRIPVWLDRTSEWARRLVWIGLALGASLWLALQVRTALVPLLLAVVIAAALRPPAARLRSMGVPSALAAAIPITATLAFFGASGWFVYARTSSTFRGDEMARNEVRDRIEEWLKGPPLDLSADQIERAEASIRAWLSAGVDSLGVAQATIAIQVIGGAVLTLVLTFFIVKDGSSMWSAITSRIAPVRVSAVRRAGHAISETLSAYVRSVVIMGVLDALLIGVGLYLLDVPLVLPLMVLTAIAGLFPLVGAVVAGLAAALVALITVGPATALWVLVLTAVVQQVEGSVMQPLIIGRRVSIHPVVVLVSLTVGGAVAGLAGAFLAVPIVGALIAAVKAFSADMEPSVEVTGPPEPTEPAPEVP